MKTSVLLADDHRIMRQGLRALLDDNPDMEVVAEAGEGRTALRLARELSPDVVVMDISMPDLNGIDAARMITAEVPGVKIIALSVHSDKRFVVEMLRAGASGYLLKDCALDELVRAIRAVNANQTYLSPEVVGTMIDEFIRASSDADVSAFSILTPREREVLQ
ncbi:MAG: response regulator transcription factor, partial [Candidatus Abyssubacteria bacterium]|nr:response regulator transcription factor [Candidatus Abyssubacteria bacterium]